MIRRHQSFAAALRALCQGLRARCGSERGAQLVEMALVLPLLLILAVGILDFGTAYNLRQILNNGAREGARLGASQTGQDLTRTSPPSVQDICNDVATYLWQAHVDLTFLGFSPGFPTAAPACPAAAAAASTSCPAVGGTPASTTFTWVYPSGTTACGTGLTIERSIVVPDVNGSGKIPSTRVTLNYPYPWLYGFNNVIGFFGAKYSGTISISTNALMANQGSGP